MSVLRIGIATVLAVAIVGGVGLWWWPEPPSDRGAGTVTPATDPGIKVWDASDGKREPGR